MSKPGFTKSWRKELESDIWSMSPLYHRVWHYLLQSVSWEKNTFPTKNMFSIHLNPGQGLFSVSQIVDGVSWIERNVKKQPNKKTIIDILRWLEFHGMITRESNGSGTYISICNWCKYQSEEKLKVTESIPQGIPQGIPEGVHTKEVKEVKEEEKPCVEYSERFLIFWKNYPNKKGKDKAFASWKKYKCDNGVFDEVMAALEIQKKSKGWLKDGGQFIPMASTWVGNRRWRDETIEPEVDEWQ